MTTTRLTLSALAAASMSVCAAAHAAAELPTVEVRESRMTPNASLGLDEHNATGSRLDLSARDTPASVSSMSSADLAERVLVRAQDAAVRMAGVSESPSPGNGGTSLSARGFAGHNSVAQMVDGTRLIVAVGTITYPFSTWPLEAVQVLRGPASVLYGDGAIGAAVNYVTKQPRFDRFEGEAYASAGSWNTVRGGVGARGPINDMVAYSIYADAQKSNGYRRDSGYQRQNLSAALSIRPQRDLQVTMLLDAGHNDDATYFGTPLRNGQVDDSLKRLSFNVDDALVKYNDRVWRVKVDYQASSQVRLRNETYAMTSKRHWRNTEGYTLNPAGNRVTRDSYLEILHDQEQIGNRFDVSLDGQLGGLKNRLVVGVDWYRSRLFLTNNSPYVGSTVIDPYNFAAGSFAQVSPAANPTLPLRRAQLQSTAVFAENVLDLAPQWKLVTGLRRDRMALDNHELRSRVQQSKDYTPLTGRAGLVWNIAPALTVYSQYATATDPLSGALALPNGSPNFDLTKGRQLELGAKGRVAALNGEWSAAVYKIEKDNLLSRDPDNPNVALQIGQQSSTGIELAFAAEPLRGWTIDANLAALRARYDDFTEVVAGRAVSRSGNTPTGVPERTANLWTGYRFLPAWQAAIGARYVGARQANTANTAYLPSYTAIDASLAWTQSPKLSLTLSVKNLANRDYALSGSAGTRWLLADPRSLQLTARSAF
ncbi:MAG: TonB-dependent receptor [Duganella sp.]